MSFRKSSRTYSGRCRWTGIPAPFGSQQSLAIDNGVRHRRADGWSGVQHCIQHDCKRRLQLVALYRSIQSACSVEFDNCHAVRCRWRARCLCASSDSRKHSRVPNFASIQWCRANRRRVRSSQRPGSHAHSVGDHHSPNCLQHLLHAACNFRGYRQFYLPTRKSNRVGLRNHFRDSLRHHQSAGFAFDSHRVQRGSYGDPVHGDVQ